jgi:glycine/D-amino acid oxidase-like deaminating enzyme
VLIGGWRDTSLEMERTFDDNTTPEIQEHLDHKLAEMDGKVEVTNRWAGTMGFTESGLPLVGPLDGMKNVYTCAGFNGHGMGFAFMSAKQLVGSL